MPRSDSSPAAAGRDHPQLGWNDQVAAAVAKAVPGWFREDLGFEADWTSVALVPASARGRLAVVARQAGVVAGLPAAAVVTATDPDLVWEPLLTDGERLGPGTVVAHLAGPLRSVLQVERVLLNLLGRLCGVATATRHLVDAVAGTGCRIYDTRKTLPGWRLLDKYAVRCGGGFSHRLGLYDAILIKDNHLAAVAGAGIDPAAAVVQARGFIERTFPPSRAAEMVVETWSRAARDAIAPASARLAPTVGLRNLRRWLAGDERRDARCDAMRCNAMRCDAMRCDAMQCHAERFC